MNICFNGRFYPAEQPLLAVQNPSFKWGDGLFETMKVVGGKLIFEDLHFERLFTSLKLLQIEKAETFTQQKLVDEILDLCHQNDCKNTGRIRLTVYRDEGNQAGYSIEAIPLNETVNEWNTEGQVVCLYPYARKAADAFANIKSASFLPYVMAGKYGVEKGVDDAIVLNAENKLCDTSRANIFLVKGNELFTPALHQGCINGVMRRVIIGEIKKLGYRIHQDTVSEEQLLAADEVFLTNAIQMIRWVKQYKQRQYGYDVTKKIFDTVSTTIFN